MIPQLRTSCDGQKQVKSSKQSENNGVMFSSLGMIKGLLAPQPIQPQQSDTHQYINRHDPEFERRKKQKQDEDDNKGIAETGLALSISVLRDFLANFLKEVEQSNQGKQTSSQLSTTANNKTGPNAQAANAYAHTAQSGQSTSLLESVDEENVNFIMLAGSDVRIIHQLQHDLKILNEAGYETLSIFPAQNFLTSLTNAVKAVQGDLT